MTSDPVELAMEWTPERIKTVIVDELRNAYASSKKLLAKYELKNRDARVAGKSYTERKPLAALIDAGNKVLKEVEQRGNLAKSMTFTVKDFMDEDSLEAVERLGFEGFLRESVRMGYPHIHTPPPLALSPAKVYTDGVAR